MIDLSIISEVKNDENNENNEANQLRVSILMENLQELEDYQLGTLLYCVSHVLSDRKVMVAKLTRNLLFYSQRRDGGSRIDFIKKVYDYARNLYLQRLRELGEED